MNEQEDTRKKSRRDLLLILLILPFGILCMFLTGQTAIRLSPEWSLNIAMKSLLDPNATFVAQGIPALIEPINPGILTQPAWGSLFLTPNAPIPTRPITSPTPSPVSTVPPPPVPTESQEEPTATATIPGPIIPPTQGGPARADLRIQKSDNSATYTPGTSITYTIRVTNLGPDYISRFNVVDDIPAVISGLSINCAPASSCGTNTSSGNRVAFTGAALPNGGGITISVSGTVASSATGDLVNTASVFIPNGVRAEDPNSTNNTATDRDTQLSVYDLAIAKSNSAGVNNYVASQINYRIVVTNNGPSDAIGVTVVDNRPAQIASWTWACAAVVNAGRCTGGISSTFTDTVDIQSGGRIEYQVSAIPAIPPAPQNPQDITNTASINFPSDPTRFRDPDTSNNSDTIIDIPYIDLQITKEVGAAAYVPGGPVAYTVTVTNNSTFSLTGITVTDNIPTLIDPLTWNWTCAPAPGSTGASCTPGPGNTSINDTAVNLPPNTSVVYSITATVLPTATDDLVNTASVVPPAGLSDANPGNNLATETTPLSIDLLIAKTDNVDTYSPPVPLTYIVTVTNNSAIALNGIAVTDDMPSLISSWTWTCSPGPGASCTPGPNSTNINDTAVNLPVGGSVTYTIIATVSGTAIDDLINTATVSAPAGFVDIDLTNNSATDTDTYTDGTEPDIGPPDGDIYPIGTGETAAFFLSQPIVATNNDTAADFVFYENLVGSSIFLDVVLIEISTDGTVWFPVFDWGDGTADTNTNVDINVIGGICATEYDNCEIPSANLYNGSGITIDVDNSPLSSVPAGNYFWIRFTDPGTADGTHVDAIQILP